MKKLFSLVGIFAFGALFLTGCGGSGSKLVCTGEETTESGSYKAEVTATLKDDKVDAVSAELEFSTEEEATQYASLMKLAEAFMEEGTDLGISSNGKKVTIKNMSAVLSNGTDEEGNEVNLIGGTKDDFVKYVEEQGYSCK